MKTVGAFDAKTHFSALLEEVQQGKDFIITKHGHPVAKLIPFTGPSEEQSETAILKLREFGSEYTLGLDWKELRDKGRR